jgi:hypothetical protein
VKISFDWCLGISILLALNFLAFVLLVWSTTASDGAWAKDCSALGKHRLGDVVYECKVVKHEP